MSAKLRRDFFARPTAVVARELLGCALVHRCDGVWRGGWIVETEAYLPSDDAASHAARGRTRANDAMFAQPGTLYVYSIHAKFCLNLVTEADGVGAAVLIRGLQPTEGLAEMQSARGNEDPRRLTSGPAMVCQAIGVDRRHDGTDVIANADWRLMPAVNVCAADVTATSRVGVSKAADLPLRFFVDGNRFVSARAADHRRRRVEVLRDTR